MKKNAWRALKSCKSGRNNGGEENHWLIQLPDDVLLPILSRLTMKEAAKTSIVSHKWKKLWQYYPGILNFEDSRTKEEQRAISDEAFVSQDMCDFVSWVTRVVEQHHGPVVEEFKVAFALDNTYQSHIDKWVVFALAKGAKSLVLDLNPALRLIVDTYTPTLKCCIPLRSSRNLGGSKPCLKTLVLKYINITTEVVECFLQSCPFLENLRIHSSESLTSIRASGLRLALKYLDVSACPELESVDILAPELVTFSYNGRRSIQLHIKDGSLLSEVSIGGVCIDPIAYATDSLSEYFSQLEYLNLITSLHSGNELQMNLVIPPVSNLTNLKHLRLTIYARANQTLLGWISLIEACPILQKLTLELISFKGIFADYFKMPEKRSTTRPLKCLETFGLYGFVGERIDLEFAAYVIDNAIALQQVIIDFKWNGSNHVNNPGLRFSVARAKDLGEKLPPGAQLILNEC